MALTDIVYPEQNPLAEVPAIAGGTPLDIVSETANVEEIPLRVVVVGINE